MGRRGRSVGRRVRSCCRSTLAFLFSNVGVIVLVAAYTVTGAFMFQAIEGASEIDRHNNMTRERERTVEFLWQNVTLALNTFNETEVNIRINSELMKYQRVVVVAVKRGWEGARGARQWSFSSGFLYSLTVISTIGYGNLAPRTSWGKLATICYALLGMPLFLLYLTNLGEVLARWFKCVYALVCLCKGCPGFSKRRVRRKRVELSEAESIEKPEGWSRTSSPVFIYHSSSRRINHRSKSAPQQNPLPYLPGFNNGFQNRPNSVNAQNSTSLIKLDVPKLRPARRSLEAPRTSSYEPFSTIRSNPEDRRGRRICFDETIEIHPEPKSKSYKERSKGKIGEDVELSVFKNVSQHKDAPRMDRRFQEKFKEASVIEIRKVDSRQRLSKEHERTSANSDYAIAVNKNRTSVSYSDTVIPSEGSCVSESEFGYITFDVQTITVPLSVCVAVMVCYIMVGSMLFGMWENWDLLDGAYFCFISLSSIGFGDIVPGERVYSGKLETSFIACSVYLLLGMALIAMCFNLMQEQVIHYFAGLKRALKRICRCKR